MWEIKRDITRSCPLVDTILGGTNNNHNNQPLIDHTPTLNISIRAYEIKSKAPYHFSSSTYQFYPKHTLKTHYTTS